MLSKVSKALSSTPIPQYFNKAANKVGKAICDSKAADKIIPHIDANGANNTFETLVGLMSLVVILPRVRTAYKRNPNDREATRDEITEILFRDITTCTTILFALKILNSLIAGKVGKLSGLPMTNIDRTKVFQSTAKGIQGIKEKASEFFASPLEKLKTEGKNILNVIHPTEGRRALRNSEFASKYSGKDTFEKIEKTLAQIDFDGGDSDKIVKNNVIKDLIKTAQKSLADAKTRTIMGTGNSTDEVLIQSKIDKLTEMAKQNNLAQFFKNGGEKIDDSLKPMFIDYFTKEDNSLVTYGKRLNGGLRTAALAIESGFLGFGLPTLNQIRLEKKYLSEKKIKEPIALTEIYNTNENGETTLAGSKLKSEEVKLFERFVK